MKVLGFSLLSKLPAEAD